MCRGVGGTALCAWGGGSHREPGLPAVWIPPGLRPPAGPMKRQVAVKSTRGFALKSTHGIAIKSTNMAAAEKGDSAPVCRTTRQFYDGEESCYIIDAKLEGNLGRYLNVSTGLRGVVGQGVGGGDAVGCIGGRMWGVLGCNGMRRDDVGCTGMLQWGDGVR